MIAPLTPNTQAILLLTAPLIAGRSETSSDLLTPGEYNRLARQLRDQQKQPADLIGTEAKEIVGRCAQVVGRVRLEALLGRGFLLSQAVAGWNARAIWVVSRADGAYPRRLKGRLKEDAPPLLYGCGEAALLESGGLAVVGSRQVDDELLTYAEAVGRLAATAGRTLISGGARGIDQAAMRGAGQAGGTAIGVLADSLERAALAREHRQGMMDGQLTLVSPFDPAAGFNVGHAMQRNKLIYALADAALVVSSDYNKGGTWAGAVEQLEKFTFGPVFVRIGGNVGKGNEALIRKGAHPWPEPKDGEALQTAIAQGAENAAHELRQDSLPLLVKESPLQEVTTEPVQEVVAQAPVPPTRPVLSEGEQDPAAQLFSAVRTIVGKTLLEPTSEEGVARLLGVSKTQAKHWLKRLVEDGAIEKMKKPVRYRSIRTQNWLNLS